MPEALEPILVSIDQACELMSIARSKIYEEIGNGLLRAVKQGRRVKIPLEELRRRAAELPPARIKAPAPKKAA